MTAAFLASLAVTVILIIAYATSLKRMFATEGKESSSMNVRAGIFYALLMVASFCCLESFARLLAIWFGYAH